MWYPNSDEKCSGSFAKVSTDSSGVDRTGPKIKVKCPVCQRKVGLRRTLKNSMAILAVHLKG